MDEEKQNPPIGDDSISMLRKSLYAKEESTEVQKRNKELFTPKNPVVMPEAIVGKRPELIDEMTGKIKQRKAWLKWIAIGTAGVIVFITAIGITLWYRGTQQVVASQVGLSITAPANFISGSIIKYIVTVTNNSNVAWGPAHVLFVPPSGFVYKSSTPNAEVSVKDMTVTLPGLSAKKSETFEVTGQLLGDQGSTALARAEVVISKANYPKETVVTSTTVNTVLSQIPLDVSVEAGKQSAVGERVSAIIHIRNLGDTPIENAVLKLTPDQGMQLATEDSGFSAEFSVLDSYWKLPIIKPFDQIDKYVVLYVQGNPGDQRTLGIAINKNSQNQDITLRTIDHVISIASAQLAVSQLFNNTGNGKLVLTAGQRVDGMVKYQNTGSTGLTDAIISVKFEGAGLDAGTIKLSSGSYNPKDNAITWTGASIPALKRILPGQSGQIAYSFGVLPYDKFLVSPNGKNQQMVATATLDSPDLTAPTGQLRKVISDRFLLPIQTGVLLGADAYYDDGRLGITSSGPIPPRVGEQTSYTVRVRIGSTLNDIENATAVIVLPDGVSFTNNIYKTTGDAQFNERTNTMTWTIPLLEGLTGRSTPLHELDMQVAITPGADKKGKELELVQSITGAGNDSFTDTKVTAKVSEMPTTRSASPQNGEVQ